MIRTYDAGDKVGWLRCRTLSFLATAYFDDVLTSKPRYDAPSIELVAIDDALVIGVLDITIDGSAATIETIAIHPDRWRRRAATGLLDAARPSLIEHGVATLDAWTRDDVEANRWYEARGFAETFRYLHVYAADDEVGRAIVESAGGLTPVTGFFHADVAREAEMRQHFRRVHVCRRYELRLA